MRITLQTALTERRLERLKSFRQPTVAELTEAEFLREHLERVKSDARAGESTETRRHGETGGNAA